MDSRTKVVFSGLTIVVALVLSLLTAVILFRFMESSAEATIQDWKFGGAFAGFLATFFVVTGAMPNMFKLFTEDEIRKYTDRIQELELKVLKGAPCPPGFVGELDEWHRISFVRPAEWTDWKPNPIYVFNQPVSEGAFQTNLNVCLYGADDIRGWYRQLDWGEFDPERVELNELYDKCYELSKTSLETGLDVKVESGSLKEYITVNEIKSLRFLHSFEVEGSMVRKTMVRQCGLFVWMSDRKSLLEVTFSDAADSFTSSSEAFNKIVSSVRFW